MMHHLERLRHLWERWQYGLDCRQRFYESLADLLDSKTGALDAMKEMTAEYRRHGIDNVDARFVLAISSAMADGYTITDALSSYVPNNEVMVISAGREGGQLAKGLRDAAETTRHLGRVRRSIFRRSMKPTAFYCLGLLILIGGHQLLTFYTQFLPVARWDQLSRNFYYFGAFVIEYGVVLLGLLLLLLLLMRYLIIGVPQSGLLAVAYDRYRPLADKLPPWSIYRVLNAFAFLASFAALQRNRLAPQDALEVLYEQSSDYLRQHIECMLKAIEQGESPGEAITATGLLETKQQMSLRIVSRTSGFASAIERISGDNLQSVEDQLNRAFAVYNLFGWLFVGCMIAWAALTQMSVSLSIT
ncbi:type II secretion system F family protein [Marinobacterium arenosum]|uniref:type II secretion system F family protein n=1 Tax=Marinobacterium arenosum TaxID=2862496 RepID=UPI001C98501F|nr:type II secretion system F family protein [Marinobacterium arenosum]MBY4677949.1 type II secretion system F family protein [Marinobacterium arenosum]